MLSVQKTRGIINNNFYKDTRVNPNKTKIIKHDETVKASVKEIPTKPGVIMEPVKKTNANDANEKRKINDHEIQIKTNDATTSSMKSAIVKPKPSVEATTDSTKSAIVEPKHSVAATTSSTKSAIVEPKHSVAATTGSTKSAIVEPKHSVAATTGSTKSAIVEPKHSVAATTGRTKSAIVEPKHSVAATTGRTKSAIVEPKHSVAATSGRTKSAIVEPKHSVAATAGSTKSAIVEPEPFAEATTSNAKSAIVEPQPDIIVNSPTNAALDSYSTLRLEQKIATPKNKEVTRALPKTNGLAVSQSRKSMDVQYAIPAPLELQDVKKPLLPGAAVSPLSLDKTDNNCDFTEPGFPDMRRLTDRLKTFSNWPVSFLDPETLAKDGFYYLNRGDEVRCAFCKVEIMRWEPGDDPAADHRKWAPQCPSLRLKAGETAAPGPCADSRDECGAGGTRAGGAALPLPANPEYRLLGARLASYKHWPQSLRLKPKDLADAGLFYTGKGDQTKCFYCDGGLKDWEDDDVPWEQHARWFDRCPYVRLVMGRDYIQKVKTEASLIPSTSQKPAEVSKPAAEEKSTEVEAGKESSSSDVNDEKICKICFVNERNVCFVPCGHVVACAKCALCTNKCPLCRRTFTNAIRLYYA